MRASGPCSEIVGLGIHPCASCLARPGISAAGAQTEIVLARWPSFAAWQHLTARQGFEVAFVRERDGGFSIEGCTTAVESNEPWIVSYRITLDANGQTRHARVMASTRAGEHERTLESDGAGLWRIDGAPAPLLDGCLDVDLESSALTNAFPIRRMALAIGRSAAAPAAYVRALDLRVERLEQQYRRIDERSYDYASPAFAFEVVVQCDAYGLAIDYPQIARRVG